MTDSDATQGDNMSPAEFAKLMGAYPQPAENPLPTYGGYMDNSDANFAWVNNNDYFGAENEMERYNKHRDEILEVKARLLQENEGGELYIDDPDQEAENDAIYEVLSKYYPEVYGAESPKTRTFIVSSVDYETDGEELDLPQDFTFTLDEHDTADLEGSTDMQEIADLLVDNISDETGWLVQGFYFQEKMPDGTLVDLDAETFEAIHDGRISKKELDTLYSYVEYLEGKCGGNQYDEFTDAGLDPYRTNDAESDEKDLETIIHHYNKQARFLRPLVEKAIRNGCFDKETSQKIMDEGRPLGLQLVESDYFRDAEMEELDDGVASITNRFGEGVGIIQVDDEDLEDVSVEITDGDGDVVYEGILGDEDVPEMEEDDFYYTENKKKSSILPMALGVIGAVFAYQPVMDFLSSKGKKEEKMAETPELVENPNTGNLDPAQYEEMVVESTGYAVDVIPQVLDGSFMGSRFAALPTDRYVNYNEPGIGAHTDIALDRNEMYLEPEMAMVQASESVKESQAPGQSPYNSVDGEENRDFDMRVLKETQVISLDPAAKPFIPQSMSGYTGNANTPPSVYDKMFNIGVLGQTPAFVPGSGDIGSSHTGSRSATPNSLGIAGSVGGPLSDQVNANYTDGTTSMSLAQWAIENTVNQSSDTEAVVIDRSSGAMKRVRRV